MHLFGRSYPADMNKPLFFIIIFLSTNNILATTCKYITTQCTEAGGTRNIDGVDVTLDCWRKKDIYECLEDADNKSNKIDVLNALSVILTQTEEIRKKLYEQT